MTIELYVCSRTSQTMTSYFFKKVTWPSVRQKPPWKIALLSNLVNGKNLMGEVVNVLSFKGVTKIFLETEESTEDLRNLLCVENWDEISSLPG